MATYMKFQVPLVLSFAMWLASGAVFAQSVENLAILDSRINANQEVLGPVLYQNYFFWCFAYVSADLVSQELKIRVSPSQIALNQYANSDTRIRNDFKTTLEIGGWPDIAIAKQNQIGFCPLRDSFNSELQAWVENPAQKMPDRNIKPITVTTKIYRNAIEIPWGEALPIDFPDWRDDAAWKASKFPSLGTNCRFLFDRKITCDSYSPAVLNKIRHMKIDVLDREILRARELPNDSVASSIGWESGPVGSFDQVGLSLAVGAYTVQKSEKENVTLTYKPYSPIFQDRDFHILARLAYLSNQCDEKVRIQKPISSVRATWQSKRNDTFNVLETVNNLIGSGKIMGLIYPQSNGPHIVTVIGRICEPELVKNAMEQPETFEERDRSKVVRQLDCLYQVRNSNNLKHKYISAEFIRNLGKEVLWIE